MMGLRTALDTNIPSVILGKLSYSDLVVQRVADARRDGTLTLSGFCFAELLAIPKATDEFLMTLLERSKIELDLSIDERVWTVAGHSYSRYAQRRRKSDSKERPRRIAVDFLIGAHALLHADRLMTLDVGFYETNFPELTLFAVHA
jgi:predicted nucleic acid-binding protein